MKKVIRIFDVKWTTEKGYTFNVDVKAQNNRFFNEITNLIKGTETDKSIDLTLDNVSIPLELWELGIKNKPMVFKAYLLVEENGVDFAYDFETNFYIKDNGYMAVNVEMYDDKERISVLTITIPPFNRIIFQKN